MMLIIWSTKKLVFAGIEISMKTPREKHVPLGRCNKARKRVESLECT